MNYNFFDELVLCMKEQELLEFFKPFILVEGEEKKLYVTLHEVLFIKKLEDEMLRGLENGN
jgi:hypothetical protein